MKRTTSKNKTPLYSADDLRDVSDNPKWTKKDVAAAKPFDEVFPGMRKGRGPNKAPTKELVSIRFSPDVLAHFRGMGPRWQSKIDETLRASIAAGQKKATKRKIG